MYATNIIYMRNKDTSKAHLKHGELYLIRISNYNLNPNKCKNCNFPLSYNKRKQLYCSHRCSAIFNNTKKITPRNGNSLPKCKICGKKLWRHTQQYCSKCGFIVLVQSHIKNKNPLCGKILKKYLILTRGYICNKCKLTEWLGHPIPLESHHKNGDSNDNHEENIELLCKNCHAFTDTYGIKNKGKGRINRRK